MYEYDEKCETNLKSKITQAKQVFYEKKNLFTTNTFSLNTGNILLKSFVWSIALYGAKT